MTTNWRFQQWMWWWTHWSLVLCWDSTGIRIGINWSVKRTGDVWLEVDLVFFDIIAQRTSRSGPVRGI